MNQWIRRILVLAQIGGGSVGLATTAQLLRTGGPAVIAIIFVAVFALGIVAGLTLAERRRAGLWLSCAFQALQIPFFWTPHVGYGLVAGVSVVPFLSAPKAGVMFNAGAKFLVGMQPGPSWVFGVNLIPMVLIVLLIKLRNGSEQHGGRISSEGAPSAPPNESSP